eukprot:CCRYP_017181-RI/>CCRYP_017181-RI protein AED:0.48 eAED:1.00 QI:0/0/0/1/0/0/2/0/74
MARPASESFGTTPDPPSPEQALATFSKTESSCILNDTLCIIFRASTILNSPLVRCSVIKSIPNAPPKTARLGSE